ncbi:hypothetical protein DEU56DRAFT_902726 [Suillus clintonianus]|uniref:uncharacterized protein n=1 Tax=Suillus clintonianus TaxID=1904413 RepID=UPI001B8678AF|nr:uncharacterized protein DEU56DRAFT_902726 [Suillus clintonianus]KAG2130243.1 hypothetical protein DEU56DRAFT_902726 [Suillus clintonianus]
MSTAYTFQSPSVTLEKGAYRMRAPHSTRPGSSLTQSLMSAKQPPLHTKNRKLAILISILAFASITCFFIAYHLFTTRFAPTSFYVHPQPHRADALPKVNPPAHININSHDPQTKYLSYLPHSGLHNQRIALENALILAKLLNRTLLVPFLRLGKPIRYVSFHKLQRFLTLGSKTGLEHCPLVPISTPTPLECLGYEEWSFIPWDQIVDLHLLGDKLGVNMIQWDGSPAAEWMKMSKLNTNTNTTILDRDTLTLQDVGPYDFRFLDTLDDVSPIRDKYLRSIYIPALAQAPERLLQIGTLFGSSRLKLRGAASKTVRRDVRRGMAFTNSDLSRVADTIHEALGGVYIGAHLRVGDGQFEELGALNARLVWWKLVHLVCGLDLEETLALEQQINPFAIDEDLDPPLLHPDMPSLRVPHPPLPPLPHMFKHRERCRAPLHTSAELQKLNAPLFIATDSPNPAADPLFSIYMKTFPCIFFLSDFASRLTPLDALTNPYDQVPLKGFLIPVLDAMVLAGAREVVVTDGSTFGAFVGDVLWRRHWGFEIVQRG